MKLGIIASNDPGSLIESSEISINHNFDGSFDGILRNGTTRGRLGG